MRTRLLLAAAAVAIAASSLARAAGDGLIVFDWSGYEEPPFHQAYIDKHGASPDFSFFGDEDEALEKMRAGFKVDIAHPCSQSVAKWREAGMLQPLDTSRIEGWNDILPGIKAMKNLVTTEDGKAWFLPFDWGNTALIYNTEKVPAADAASVRILADPKYKDRVTIGDNVDDAYALASLAIGLKDWTQMTDAQFEEASTFLREVHKNVRLYWTDSTDINQAFTGGEIDLGWGWNETVASLSREGVPIAMNRDTKEGMSTWVCGYVLMKDAPGSLDKAYDFLSAVNKPSVSDYIVTAFGYGHGNGAGMAAIDPEVLKASGYDDIQRFVDKTLFQQPLSAELKQKMIAEFEKIKAGY